MDSESLFFVNSLLINFILEMIQYNHKINLRRNTKMAANVESMFYAGRERP